MIVLMWNYSLHWVQMRKTFENIAKRTYYTNKRYITFKMKNFLENCYVVIV